MPLPTFPGHGFVHAAGATVLLDQVTEYELVEGRELALTVLRSTGLISRNENPSREDPAGPEIPVPGAQLLGPWQHGFAILPHAGSWSDADALRAADRARLGALVTAGTGAAELAPSAVEGLRLDGDGVVLSSLRRRDSALELRLVAERPDATAATIHLPGGIAAARDVDLLGRVGATLAVPADGSLAVPLRAWEIRTLRIEPRPAAT